MPGGSWWNAECIDWQREVSPCIYFFLQKTVGLCDAFKYSTRTVLNPYVDFCNKWHAVTRIESTNRVLCNFSHWEAFPRKFFYSRFCAQEQKLIVTGLPQLNPGCLYQTAVQRLRWVTQTYSPDKCNAATVRITGKAWCLRLWRPGHRFESLLACWCLYFSLRRGQLWVLPSSCQ
jgi:hypothetical protein